MEFTPVVKPVGKALALLVLAVPSHAAAVVVTGSPFGMLYTFVWIALINVGAATVPRYANTWSPFTLRLNAAPVTIPAAPPPDFVAVRPAIFISVPADKADGEVHVTVSSPVRNTLVLNHPLLVKLITVPGPIFLNKTKENSSAATLFPPIYPERQYRQHLM